MTPIFIIGTERSGSNLLRLILNSHSEITIPHPPHIVAYFAPLERYYGNLDQFHNFEKLASDIVDHVARHIHPWPTPIDLPRLLRNAYPHDAFGLFLAIYEQHRIATRKRLWGCKSTFMIAYLSQILHSRPRARLIWLVRDPRDVALSSMNSVFNPFHPCFTAELWRAQQLQGLHAVKQGMDLLLVHYEDLIKDPEGSIERICHFIDIRPEREMLNFFESAAAKTIASLSLDWCNSARPVISNNAGKFAHALSAGDVRVVEAVAGDVMEELGYQRVTRLNPQGNSRSWKRCFYHARNQTLKLRVEARSLLQDRNYRLRLNRFVRMRSLGLRLKMGLR